MASFHQHTTGEEVAKAFKSRCAGKTFIITGTSSGGIGGATAIALAHGSPKTLFLASRSLAKTQPIIDSITHIDANIQTIFVELDLSDKDSTVLESESAETVDALFNNAGVMCTMPYQTTKQGVEMQFGTNHLGHFLWTNLLLPRVLAAGPHARIVNTASTGFVLSHCVVDNLNWDEGKTYHPWLAYGSSKTANVLFTTYLSSHLKGKGVDCFALQPGMPMTPLYIHTTTPGLASFAEAGRIMAEKYGNEMPPSGDMKEDEKTLEQACSTLLVAALSPELDGESGLFLRNCQPFPTVEYATAPESAEKLWRLSEELVGQKFEI